MKFIITESQKKHLIKKFLKEEGEPKIDPNIDAKDDSTIGSFAKKVINYGKELMRQKLSLDNPSNSNPSNSNSSSNQTSQNFDSLSNSSSGSVDDKWMTVTKKVINKFEGGYWNGTTPKNVQTSKTGICPNHPKGSMGASTETMFGLDRYNGNIESSPDGKEFFGIIDNQKKELGMDAFCKKWKWGYTGGENEEKLKNLAAKIMKRSYDRNAKAFFTPELQKRVEANDRLLMHFSYACWNGPGFFQKFANSLKNSVTSGKSDSELLSQAISDRHNTKLLRQEKVAAVLTDPNLNLA